MRPTALLEYRTSTDVIPSYGSCHQQSTVLYTKIAIEPLTCRTLAGNRTRPAEGAWHVCGSYQQAGSTGCQPGRCAKTRISALLRGNRFQPNPYWRLIWVAAGADQSQ